MVAIVGAIAGAMVSLATGIACTFPLDADISCGDGVVDHEAGEECEPGEPSTYENACAGTPRSGGIADCDPTSCTIINTKEQCAICGDGIVDEDLGEQCDGDNLNGAACPGGVGTLQCSTSCRFDTTYCRPCGNGVLDPGEECDPYADGNDLSANKPACTDLESPYLDGRRYTSGQPGACLDDCRWDRTGCSYCGNGQLETEDLEVTPELCDGNAFDIGALEDELASSVCALVNDDLWPTTWTCESCTEVTFEEDMAEPCCVKTGGACPAEGSPVRCCSELDAPDDDGPPCQVIWSSSGVGVNVCR